MQWMFLHGEVVLVSHWEDLLSYILSTSCVLLRR